MFWYSRLLVTVGDLVARLAKSLGIKGAGRLSSALGEYNSRTRVRRVGRDHQGGLQQAVDAAFEIALRDSLVLPDWLMTLEGMSGRRFRNFLNSLCRMLPGATYLEVGSLFGSTACAALHGNAIRAVCIDNWSEFGGSPKRFLENVSRAQTESNRLRLIEADFRGVNFAEFGGSVDVYFFDGPHSELDQYDGIVRALPALKPEFVLIVDDYNWPQVRKGTRRALARAGLVVKSGWEIRTTMNNTHPQQGGATTDWHNGYFIAVAALKEV